MTNDLDAGLSDALEQGEHAAFIPRRARFRASAYLASDTATVGRFSRVHWCMEPS